MSHFSNWKEKKAQVREANEWLSNKDKVHSQSGGKYKLSVRIDPKSIQYCGQSNAGANNYHTYSSSFSSYINSAIERNSDKIFSDALKLLESACDELGLMAKEEISDMLDEVSNIKDPK